MKLATGESGNEPDIQKQSAQEEINEQRENCRHIASALKNNSQVLDIYVAFLYDEIEYQDIRSSLRTIGNAAEGVTEAGREKPEIIQDAINEVEEFDFGEEGVQTAVLGYGAVFESEEGIQELHVNIEINRQIHFGRVLLRLLRENDCFSYPEILDQELN